MDLEARVRRLEELVAGPVFGDQTKTIRARRVEIVNEQGQVQTVLTITQEQAVMVLTDPGRNAKAMIGVGKEGPHIILTRPDGNVALRLGVSEKGDPTISLSDAKQQPVVMLSLTGNNPALDFRDQQGMVRLSLNVLASGTPFITCHDPQGTRRVSLSTIEGPNGHAFLSLHDANGKEHFFAAVADGGTPQFVISGTDGSQLMFNAGNQGTTVVVSDGQQQLRLALGLSDKNDPFITLYNDQSKPRVSLGVGEEYSGVAVNDSHEKGRVTMTVNADERPAITLRDESNCQRIVLTEMPDRSVGVALYDPQGKLMAMLSGRQDCRGLLVNDPTGRPRAILTFGPEGPALVMTDEFGKETYSAP
jgi:hypothetical protein